MQVEKFEKDPLLRDLSKITVNTMTELSAAKTELEEKDQLMKEMNELANQRFKEMSHNLLSTSPKIDVSEKIKHQQKISKSIDKIVDIIEDVLSFVRESKLDLRTHYVNDIVNSAIESLTVPSSINISSNVNGVSVLCDARKLEAVFLNLVKNSIDALEEQGNITISSYSTGNKIAIQIQDSGKGIPEHVVGKIFEPLYTTKIHGSGLGLSICQMIVEQHGGIISAKNNPTRFIVELPLKPL